MDRWTENVWRGEGACSSTFGVDFSQRVVQVNEQLMKARIWDASGKVSQRRFFSPFYRHSHGIILVYDITNKGKRLCLLGRGLTAGFSMTSHAETRSPCKCCLFPTDVRVQFIPPLMQYMSWTRNCLQCTVWEATLSRKHLCIGSAPVRKCSLGANQVPVKNQKDRTKTTR